jgi:hypothetical protein
MAYSTINKHTDYFNTKLYTGTGSSNAITGVGHQPDFTWIKQRNETRNSSLYDSVRGVQIRIQSSSSDGNSTLSNGLTAFGTDGFTVVSHDDVNKNSGTYASWNWKAGTTGSGTTGGSGSAQSYSYSVNTTAGFSIVKYTGNATAGHTIPHHLGAVPKMILFKQITGANVDWRVYHEAIGNTHRLALNGSGTSNDDDSAFNDTSPTSSVFTVGGSSSTNPSADVVAYCFTNKTGYSKFGSYKGNGNADGTFIYTGFKPAFVIIKGAVSGDGNAGQNWELYDNKRDGYNGFNDALFPNTTAAESVEDRVDLLSNGFKIRVNSDGVNDNNSTYIYMAFGQSLVGSNNIPCNAR